MRKSSDMHKFESIQDIKQSAVDFHHRGTANLELEMN